MADQYPNFFYRLNSGSNPTYDHDAWRHPFWNWVGADNFGPRGHHDGPGPRGHHGHGRHGGRHGRRGENDAAAREQEEFIQAEQERAVQESVDEEKNTAAATAEPRLGTQEVETEMMVVESEHEDNGGDKEKTPASGDDSDRRRRHHHHHHHGPGFGPRGGRGGFGPRGHHHGHGHGHHHGPPPAYGGPPPPPHMAGSNEGGHPWGPWFDMITGYTRPGPPPHHHHDENEPFDFGFGPWGANFPFGPGPGPRGHHGPGGRGGRHGHRGPPPPPGAAGPGDSATAGEERAAAPAEGATFDLPHRGGKHARFASDGEVIASDNEGAGSGSGSESECNKRRCRRRGGPGGPGGRGGFGMRGGRGGSGPCRGRRHGESGSDDERASEFPYPGARGHHGHGRGRGGPFGPRGGRGGRHGGPHGHGGPGPFGGLPRAIMDLVSNVTGTNTAGGRFPLTRNPNVDFVPNADIFSLPTHWTIHIALPGAQRENVSLSFDEATSSLHVAGVVYRPGVDETMHAALVFEGRKSEIGVFERIVRIGGVKRLPAAVKVEEISARLKDGVLVVTIPKVEGAEENVTKKVPIESSGSESASPIAEKSQEHILDQDIDGATLNEKDTTGFEEKGKRREEFEESESETEMGEYEHHGHHGEEEESEGDETEYVRINVQ